MPIEINELEIAVQNALRNSDDDTAEDLRGENLAQMAAAGKVSISGRDYIESINHIKLDQWIDNHHRAVVRLNFVSADSPNLNNMANFVGEQISIKLGDELYGNDTQYPVTFAGVVTGVKIVSETGADTVAVIVAQSPTIKMAFGHVNNTYKNTKASECISAVLGAANLTGGTIDASSVVHDQIFQYEETNWQFARRMASSYGVYLFYDGEKLHATNAKSRSTNTLRRSDIGALKLILGATASEVEVQGWDYKEKKEIVGTATGTSATGIDSREGGTLRKSGFVHTVKDYVEAGTAVSKAHADVIAKTVAMSHIQGLGVMKGQSCAFGVNVGKNVKVENYETVLNGSYFVTYVRHELAAGQYSNHFEASPTNSAYPRVTNPPLRETALQIAIVTNNKDEEDLGRVKVKFPWRSGEESHWARMAHVDAGKDKGLYTLPDIDDEVIVGFEFGDFNRPVILGNLYNGKDKPIRGGSEMIESGKSKLKVFKTRGGNEIVLDDTSGTETVSITQKDGKNIIKMTLDGPSISIISDNGDINIKGKAINIETTSGDIALNSKGKITTESTADTQIKATGALKAEGMNAEIKGQTNGKFEAGAMLDLKGNGMVNVKGGMINLN